MAGRAQAFSDPTVIDIASEHFITVAENCSPLQRQADAKGDFFRLVAEQGHYAGRTYPTSTRQGYYAFTADGRVLAAANARDPERMAELLRTALHRWGVLTTGAEGGALPPPGDYVAAQRDHYPAGGLVLQLAARDLPRDVDARKDDWRRRAWNLDYAWFTRDEAASLVPQPPALGARRTAPWEVIRRLARFHLRDFVRGEPSVWPEGAIRHGELVAEVTAVTRDRVRLRLGGAIRLEWEAQWVRPENGETRRSSTGFDAVLYGEAEWDGGPGRFVAFDLLAAGQRRGTNQYNNREDDLGPAPMGVAAVLAGAAPRDRTPPHTIHHPHYFGAAADAPDAPDAPAAPDAPDAPDATGAPAR